MNIWRGKSARKCFLPGLFSIAMGWIVYVTVLAIGNIYGDQDEELRYGAPTEKDGESVPTSVVLEKSTAATITDPRKLKLLRRLVENRNIRAEEKLKQLSATKNFRFVIVVQIHDRITYIRALMDSLAATRNITDALVIFSHDVVDGEIDKLAWEAETNFEMVQIYFPHSIQLYPNEFPGPDALDCPERIGKAEAMKKKCLNYNHPDTYGNYRSSRVTQVKHHWWWKLQFIFTRVSWARTLPVIFLEEDHYVLPDALVVLDKLLALRETACTPKCPVLSVGHHKTKSNDEKNAYRSFFVEKWVGARDNIGIVFDYDHYQRINGCASTFCQVDDYNWDWTLHFVGADCLKKEYAMLVPVASRVLHIGDCGGMHHKKSCNPQESVRKALETVSSRLDKLFPESLEKSKQSLVKLKSPKTNGGWGDPRDRDLCLNMTRYFAAPI